MVRDSAKPFVARIEVCKKADYQNMKNQKALEHYDKGKSCPTLSKLVYFRNPSIQRYRNLNGFHTTMQLSLLLNAIWTGISKHNKVKKAKVS